jgi:hypothetical protein
MANTQRLSWFGKIGTGLLSAVSLCSCGGFFPSADTIVSIQVAPASAQILNGATQQFTATATYGNNTTGDITSTTSWQSSSPTVAIINTSGLATAMAIGTTSITAKSGSATGTATLTVSTKTITSITISPANPTISLSLAQSQQFTATATYSDGTFGDITTSSTWTSSNNSIATVSSTGLASPVAIGSVTIAASASGVAGTTTLTVTQ